MVTFDDHLETMQDAHYDRRNKKPRVEIEKVQNIRVINKSRIEVDIFEVGATRLLHLHQTIGEALTYSIMEQEVENMRLKKRINKLEEALNPTPLFMTPLAIKELRLGSIHKTQPYEYENKHILWMEASLIW